mgnify:CR=1 FL=1
MSSLLGVAFEGRHGDSGCNIDVGVRGKGLQTLALLPFKLLRAFWQSLCVMRRVQPDVVVGLGGYITFPGGMMGVLCGKPLVLHEQNSVAGMANKVLAGVADRVFAAFPKAMPKAEWVGNPLRAEFLSLPTPEVRFAGRSGPLRVLVVGHLRAEKSPQTVWQAARLLRDQPGLLIDHVGAALESAGELRAVRDAAQAGGQEHGVLGDAEPDGAWAEGELHGSEGVRCER